MKGSQELIAFYNRRKQALEEKASAFNMFLEGYCEGMRDTKKAMIDKACKAHCSCCMAYSACSRRGKFGCWELDKIRKAMEE